jgi:hypothetical protein
MSSVQAPSIVAPVTRFYSGRQETFLSDGPTCWRRATPEDMARIHTGYDRESREPHLGVYIVPVSNGLVRIGFDVFRLSLHIRDSIVERLQSRWRGEAASLPKTLLRRLYRRTHFSRSFAKFEVQPEDLGRWKEELECVLTNPDTYESL